MSLVIFAGVIKNALVPTVTKRHKNSTFLRLSPYRSVVLYRLKRKSVNTHLDQIPFFFFLGRRILLYFVELGFGQYYKRRGVANWVILLLLNNAKKKGKLKYYYATLCIISSFQMDWDGQWVVLSEWRCEYNIFFSNRSS